jgi:hypothetical protein
MVIKDPALERLGGYTSMRLFRTILAFAIAASLALLPVGASAAGLAMVHDNAKSGMLMSSSANMPMDDCCPDDMKGVPSHTDDYKCGMGLGCVGGFVAFSGVQTTIFELLPAPASKVAIPADQVASSVGASPPFRPPRV